MTRFNLLYSLILSILAYPVFGNHLSVNADVGAKKNIHIEGMLRGAGIDSIHLFQWDGASLEKLVSTPFHQKAGSGEFRFKPVKLPVGLYFIGLDKKTYKPLLLGEEEKIQLDGNVDSIQQMRLLHSPVNQLYNSSMEQIRKLQGQFQQLIQQIRMAGGNPEKIAALNSNFMALDSARQALLEGSRKANSFVGDVVALNGYMSFQMNNQGRYKDEAHYFANEFFRFADISKESYDHIPQLMETAKTFAFTIVRAGLPAEEQQKAVDALYAKVPEGSKRHKAFLLGVTLGFQNAKADTYFVKYGDRYLAHYGDHNPPIVQYLESHMNEARRLMIGALAPDIEQPTPEGEVGKLSALRGKYVLVDFWASWCGPCRRENPNVVKLYERYNDKGFEVFSVSLDNNKSLWVKAIEKDNLNWLHVSDLKKWSSSAARDYGVSGIPFTILLDPEGKIIAKNLRGPGLEAKLRELFGG